VLVIGGGITGAGVARDAALRGLRVALVERLDWAAGTSSRSSKLIHGGVRYLEQGDVGLVREAATERSVLRRLAPHLALPVRMLMPTYGRAGHAKLGLGLWTFEHIATVAPEERHAMWSREEALEREPTLDGTRLHGAATFVEYLTDDARLGPEAVLGAHASGGPRTITARPPTTSRCRARTPTTCSSPPTAPSRGRRSRARTWWRRGRGSGRSSTRRARPRRRSRARTRSW